MDICGLQVWRSGTSERVTRERQSPRSAAPFGPRSEQARSASHLRRAYVGGRAVAPGTIARAEDSALATSVAEPGGMRSETIAYPSLRAASRCVCGPVGIQPFASDVWKRAAEREELLPWKCVGNEEALKTMQVVQRAERLVGDSDRGEA